MTRRGYIEIDCPNCGMNNRILVWDTINVQCNPEAKTALLRGEINVFTCQGCKKMVHIQKVLLYNDMEKGFMAFYFPFAGIQNGDILDYITPDGKIKEMERYSGLGLTVDIHYVFDMGELVRYIKFRDALDERIKREKD